MAEEYPKKICVQAVSCVTIETRIENVFYGSIDIGRCLSRIKPSDKKTMKHSIDSSFRSTASVFRLPLDGVACVTLLNQN